jgi:hypothetical protein
MNWLAECPVEGCGDRIRREPYSASEALPKEELMGDKQPVLRVAAVQAAPVFLDREGTVAKAAELVGAADANGAQLVVFPESFVPCYPVWLWASRADVEVEAFSRLYANAVEVPGADTATARGTNDKPPSMVITASQEILRHMVHSS